jgi:hypothetical protein
MSSPSDAHTILLDLDEIVERLRTTYNDLGDATPCAGHPLERLSIEQSIGRMIELRRSVVGYLDEWDHATYEAMRRRGWVPA